MDMDCRKIEQLISPFLDGELVSVEAGAVRSHLSVCASCQQEYEDLVRVSVSLQQMGEVLVPAPIGFKDTLMQRINEEKVITPVQTSRWFKRSWRQAAVGAAAALLLIFGATSMNMSPVFRIAENTPIIESQPGVSSSGQVTSTNNVSPAQPGVVTPRQSEGVTPVVTKDSTTPLATTDPTANSLRSAPVFLNNKERAIITTMLKVNVNGSNSALENALTLADNAQAQTQNLGQQVNNNGSYTALKITVAKSSAGNLISELSSLGTVSSKEVDKNDISARYSETLSQFQTLVTQRATLQDVSQKAQLDQRIETLESQLQDWEQKSERETIVLWLEK